MYPVVIVKPNQIIKFKVESKLPPRSGCSLEAVEPHPKKGAIKCFFFKFQMTMNVNSVHNVEVISIVAQLKIMNKIKPVTKTRSPRITKKMKLRKFI